MLEVIISYLYNNAIHLDKLLKHQIHAYLYNHIFGGMCVCTELREPYTYVMLHQQPATFVILAM